jgi:hypothetical protein
MFFTARAPDPGILLRAQPDSPSLHLKMIIKKSNSNSKGTSLNFKGYFLNSNSKGTSLSVKGHFLRPGI